MPAVAALEHSLSGPNGTLTSRDNNSGKANQFTNQITLQISEHLGVLIRVDLYLELGGDLHVWVHLIVVIGPIDSLDGRLENLDVITWVVSEAFHQHVVEGVEVLHVHLQEVLSSLGIALELFSVYKNVVHLGLPDEMHKFVFGLGKTLLVLVAHVSVSIDQVLISEVNLVSVKSHLIFLKI